MKWLRNHEAGRLRDESIPFTALKIDRNVSVSVETHQQLARDDLSNAVGSKSHDTVFGLASLSTGTHSSRDTYDELFLPSEKESLGEANTSTQYIHYAGRPAQRHLHPAQRLPRTAKTIYGLPSCLVAGLQPFCAFQPSQVVSKSLNRGPQGLGARLSHTPKEIHNECAESASSQMQKGRRRRSAQAFDPVQFAHIPSHYDLRAQVNGHDLQMDSTLPPELPPLRVVSSFRYSGIFPAPPAETRNVGEIQRPSQIELSSSGAIQKLFDTQIETSESRIQRTDLKSSSKQKGQRNGLQERFDLVQYARLHSHNDSSRRGANEGFKAKKGSSPELPPLRVVSPFRYSRVFPTSSQAQDPISYPPRAVSQLARSVLETPSPGSKFPSNLDGSNDVASFDLQTRIPAANLNPDTKPNIRSQDTFHNRIRRRKGCKNLRMAYTNPTLPLLPVLEPLDFSEFSL